MAGVLLARPRSPRVERASLARVMGGWGNGPRRPRAGGSTACTKQNPSKIDFSGEWTTKDYRRRSSARAHTLANREQQNSIMEEASSTRRVELVMKLPQLQNLIKRDPAAYRDEFEQQVRDATPLQNRQRY